MFRFLHYFGKVIDFWKSDEIEAWESSYCVLVHKREFGDDVGGWHQMSATIPSPENGENAKQLIGCLFNDSGRTCPHGSWLVRRGLARAGPA